MPNATRRPERRAQRDAALLLRDARPARRAARRRRTLIPALALLATLAAAPGASAARQYEQVSRTDGATGITPLEGGYAEGEYISADGRFAIFKFTAGYNTPPNWLSAQGIWRRDLDTNRSTQLVGGTEAILTGVTADERVMSFITSRRLVSADKNSQYDLYSFDMTTRQTQLLSRWDGPNGQAIGLVTPLYNSILPAGMGFITRDGKAALFSTDVGIGRRDLAANTTVKVESVEKQALGSAAAGDGRADLEASSDGRVFASGPDLVTPARKLALGLAYPDRTLRVSSSGATAVYVPQSATGQLAVVTTATGATRRLDLAAAAPQGLRVAGFTADERAVDVWAKTEKGEALKRVVLATGATTDLALDPELGDDNHAASTGRFALSGYAWATAAGGATLPGGVDLPSPGAYVHISSGCKGSGWPFYRASIPSTLFITPTDYGTPVGSIAYRITNTAGGVTHSGTTTGPLAIDPLKPVGAGVRVAVTVKYVDGRTTSENWNHPAPSGCPGFF